MKLIVKLALIGLLAGACEAKFQQLREVCRTVNDNLGACVTSAFCCNALGGTVEEVAGKSAVLSGSMPTNLARSIGTEDGNKGCSYNGECCVLPVLDDFDCQVCGLKGNGDLEKAVAPDIEPKATQAPEIIVPEKLITERIVNGQDADVNEWCWQVALMNATGLFGGGALIARNWVVTAAHKVAGKFLDEFIIVLGEYDFEHDNDDRTVYYTTALNVIVHPDFDPSTFDNNIALVRIPDAPCVAESVCPICLSDEDVTFEPVIEPTTTTTTTQPTTTFTTTTYAYGGSSGPNLALTFSIKNAISAVNNKQNRNIGGGGNVMVASSGANAFENLVCYMTGWGSTGLLELAPVLQEAYMQIIRDDDCMDAFADLGVENPSIPAGAFCAAEPSWSRGSCYGDGGGPLACQNRIDHTWELWGVISLGTNMCMPQGEQGPTIFTDVGEHFNWIVETIHEGDLPPAATPEDSRKAYKVPDCGSNVGKPCPDRPPYVPLGRRSNLDIPNTLNF